MLLFTTASWLCGTAVTFEMLLGLSCHARRGVGADGAALADIAAGELPAQLEGRRPRDPWHDGHGGALVGPITGGWITDNYSWPWIFDINLPVGIAVAWLAHHFWPTAIRRRVKCPSMPWGSGSSSSGSARCRSCSRKATSSLVRVAVHRDACDRCGIGLAIFIVWELTERHPIVDLGLFKAQTSAPDDCREHGL